MKDLCHAHQMQTALATLTVAKELLLMEESLWKEQEQQG
jgi:hypothetical protein